MNMKINDIGRLIDNLAENEEKRLIEIRRDIHAHPEIGFEVERTAGVVARELARLGIEHRTGVGRTGVVGYIEGGQPGPTLLLRADMDALPIHEETGLPYASTFDGRMHACGHDLHTSTLIGVAAVLKEIAPRLSGNVKLMFQPAEETPDSGALAMIGDGVLDGVDMALGFHNHPDERTGTFSYIDGDANGSSDEFEIVIHAQSGHAAHPNQAIDPIVAAAHLVMSRSGASTVSEIAAIGRPALLVPFPHALDHDQAANAAALSAAGGAQVVRQSELTPQRLTQMLLSAMNEPARLESEAKAAKGVGKPDAARLLADLAEAIASGRTVQQFREGNRP